MRSRDKTSDSTGQMMTRRRMVHALGIGGTATVAGCNDDSSTGPNQGARSGNARGNIAAGVADQTFTSAVSSNPTKIHVNRFDDVSPNFAEVPARLLFDKLVYYNKETKEYTGYAVTDWSIDGSTLTLTLRDGLTWHDGEPVTAEDLATKLKLEVGIDNPLSDFIETAGKISAADDRTVTAEMTGEVSKAVALGMLDSMWLHTRASEWQEKLEAVEGADSEDARQQARSEITSFEPERIGNGPFEWGTASPQSLELYRFGDHPDAKHVNFATFEFLVRESNQQRWRSLRNGETDGYGPVFATDEIVSTMPNHVRRIFVPALWGLGLVFDHDHPHVGNRKVRQAMAHVIDRETVAETSGGDAKAPVKIPSGFVGNFNDTASQWFLGEEDQFTRYDSTERAATLLEEAGYRKEDDTWVDESGDSLTIPIKTVAGYSDWVTAVRTMQSHLTEFGFDAKLVTRPETSYWGEYGEGDFTVATFGWTNSRAYPYFTLQHLLTSSDATSIWGVPETVPVPPLGEPDGEPREIDLPSKVAEIPTLTGTEAKKAMLELAWVVNQELPMLPLQEKANQHWLSTDGWEVLPADDPGHRAGYPLAREPRTGDLKAKE